MKQLLQRDFLPSDYEQISFQQYQRCRQGQRSVYEYTAEFMRLAERNDLRKTEGQQVVRYLDGLKLQIQDKIGVHVLRNLNEAKNMALRVELMLQDKNTRFDGGRRRYGAEWVDRVGTSSDVAELEKEMGVVENPNGGGEKESDRTLEKRPMESKNPQKNNNPYTKLILEKCY